jgi:hypothetical protein
MLPTACRPGPSIPRGRRADVRPAARAMRAIGAITVLLVAATACTGSESIPAGDAEEHYDALMEDVQAALSERDLPLTHSEASREFALRDGACLYTAGNYRSDELATALAEDGGWDVVITAVNPVLEEHGFDARGTTTRRGGLELIEAEDGYGAEFTVTGYGDVRVWGARTDESACDGEGS